MRSYKNLTRVERAFRCLQTVDLMVRPIRHRAADRVQAHIFLHLLAYYVECHLRQALAPLLFQEERLEAWQARRDPVVPAKPTREAQATRNRRRAADGLELQFLDADAGAGDALPPSMPPAGRSGGAHRGAPDGADPLSAGGLGVGPCAPSRRPVQLLTNL